MLFLFRQKLFQKRSPRRDKKWYHNGIAARRLFFQLETVFGSVGIAAWNAQIEFLLHGSS
jgi:hypothetical protein